MNGLPFQPLPAAQTAESIMQQQFEEQKRQLQEQFNLGWNTIRGRAGTTLRPVEANEILAEFHAKGQMAALELKQKYQSQMDAFKRIDAMVSQGLLSNGEDAKLEMVLGPEARKYMPKETDPMAAYGKVVEHGNKLKDELGRFWERPGTPARSGWRTIDRPAVPSKLHTARYKLVPDPRIPGELIPAEYWTPSTPEEETEYQKLMTEKQTNDQLKAELSGQVEGASRLRRVMFSSPRGLGGGAFDQKITTSMLTPDEVAEGWKGYGPSFKGQITAPISTGNIRVRSPDGKVGSIPAEDWEEAKKNGFVRI